MEKLTVDDKRLWLAASSGDESAFSELFVMYLPKLYCFALKYTKDNCLAEDAVQQVFLKCWEKKSDLGHIENISAYLHKSIRNEIIDLMRRQVLQLEYQNYMAGQLNADQKAIEPPETQLQQKQEEIFTAAVNHLSPQQKKVYQLSKERGWSHAKIAQEMNVSTHTVKWHAAAAFQSLSHFLRRHEKELFIFLILFSAFS